MLQSTLGRGDQEHAQLQHWSTEPKSPGQKNIYHGPIDRRQLTIMYLRAFFAALAFCATSTLAVVSAVFSLTRFMEQRQHLWPTLLATAAAVVVAAEVCFAWVWRAKLQRLNKQPQPHKPAHPSFNPRHTYDRFVTEQHKTSKWICIKDMLTTWFGDVPIESIKVGNVADLVTYGFWYMSREEYEDVYGEPAEVLVAELERAWGITFSPGYNPDLTFMSHLWQDIRCHYRPLAFYLTMEVVFVFSRVIMWAMGFRSGRVAGFTYYTYNAGPTDLAHQAPRVPILFQHGVGAGLLPYMLFVARLACTGHPVAAMECAHLGMRWTEVVDADTVVDALVELLEQKLGWALTCVSGHSYGTFYASRLLQLHPHLVDSLCLVDPVTFNMMTGKLIQNFVYSVPNLITWFIARDIHHATSVCRNFFWSVLCLWPEQLPARTLVVLSEGDELVPVRETVDMLRHEAPHALVLHHPNHRHADFIADMPWQDAVVASLADLLAGRDAPPPPPALALRPPAPPLLSRPPIPATAAARRRGGSATPPPAPRPDSLHGSDQDLPLQRAGTGAGTDGSGTDGGGGGRERGAAGALDGRRAAAATAGGARSAPAKTSGAAAAARRRAEGAGLLGAAAGGEHQQQQRHSDSVLVYDTELPRLRPKPHRMPMTPS